MSKPYRLYWLRQNGCDSGTPVSLEDLDATIQESVAALTGAENRILTLHLPFLDSRDLRIRSQVLRTLDFVRDGDAIRGVLPSQLAPLRDRAAWLVATHPAWRQTPPESDRRYFRTWQQVSVGLQKSLRPWIRDLYFADPSRYEDRDVAQAMLVYSVCRPCGGRPRTEFTFDVADAETLPRALHLTGCATQAALAAAEARLIESGNAGLAHRYSPIWYQDVIQQVCRKPARLMGLLGDEGMVINAIIQLGARGNLNGVKPFARLASLALRSIFGVDMRPLAISALEQATKLLAEAQLCESSRTKRRPKLGGADLRATLRSQPAALHPPSLEQGTSGRYMLGIAVSR